MEKKCVYCEKELTLPVIAGYCSKECAEKDFQKDNLETIFTEDKEIYKAKTTLFLIVLLIFSIFGIILLIIL